MIQKYTNVRKTGPVVATTAGKDGMNGLGLEQAKAHRCAVRHNPGHPIVPPAALCEDVHTTGNE